MMDPLSPEPQSPQARKPRIPRAPQPPQESQQADKPITVLVPENLLKKVKVLSALTGETVSEMVTQALRARVKKDLSQALENLREEA